MTNEQYELSSPLCGLQSAKFQTSKLLWTTYQYLQSVWSGAFGLVWGIQSGPGVPWAGFSIGSWGGWGGCMMDRRCWSKIAMPHWLSNDLNPVLVQDSWPFSSEYWIVYFDHVLPPGTSQESWTVNYHEQCLVDDGRVQWEKLQEQQTRLRSKFELPQNSPVGWSKSKIRVLPKAFFHSSCNSSSPATE
jgi:hypothetical protein